LKRLEAGGSLALVLLCRAILGSADYAWAQDSHKQVLVLYSTRPDTQLTLMAERELPEILRAGLAGRLDYYAEYMDVARIPGPEYETAFRDFLYRKYRARRFDLVVAAQDVAFQFVDQNRDQLFPDTPVVFSATDRNVRPLANATGVIVPFDLTRTLTLATALQPDVEQVFVVTGASNRDKYYESLARTQFQSLERRFVFTYLSGLRMRELEQRVATLPTRSIVYYLLFYQDGAGQNFHPIEYLDRLVAIANRPTYSWVDSTIGHGIVGGSLQQQTPLIHALADSALRVLRGELADNILTVTSDLNVGQVDWRQLRRWGISETRVPVGTRILFREPSLWDRYRVHVLGGVALLLAQAALILGLLVQRTRRRRAEGQLRASHTELHTSYQRIRDLGGRLLSAQESERARIARELHDDIGQQLALLLIDLQQLNDPDARRNRGTEGRTRGAMDRAESIARSVRELSHRLHPARLRLIGLVAALNRLQRELLQPGTEVTFSHENIPALLPPDLALVLYRTAQEALHNAIKHGAAHHVSMHLSGGAEEIILRVVDDGVGFDVDDAARRTGLGLISMVERLEHLGGTLTIHSVPGAGTRLEATVPVRPLK
jgi:signal transduction histidine kinase